MENQWISELTFGREKSFFWTINKDNSIVIRRFFKNNPKPIETLFKKEQLDRLNNYVSGDSYTNLANNVEKLAGGVEKEGIGKFLFEKFHWSTTDCQVSGHIAVIFSNSGVWQYNQNKRFMGFKKLENDWVTLVNKYYNINKKVISNKGNNINIINKKNISLYDIAFASLIFDSLTNFYNDSYYSFMKDTNYSLNILNKSHRLRLLKWLNDWGCRNFKRDFHQLASKNILGWYEENCNLLPEIYKNIWELSENDFKSIFKIFETLSKKVASQRKSGNKFIIAKIGPTSVSKILFALRPKSLIPWDEKMRVFFHLTGNAEGYLDYLSIVINLCNELENQCKDNGFHLKNLPAKIGRRDITIPKLIDEYHWVTITRNCKLPDKELVKVWLDWKF